MLLHRAFRSTSRWPDTLYSGRRLKSHTASTSASSGRVATGSLEIQYHPKIRALPFVITPDEAKARLSPFAAIQTSTRSKDDLEWDAFMSTFRSKLGLKSVDKILPPKRLKAVYFPVWVLQGHFKVTDPKWSEQWFHVDVNQSHVPGTAYEPLSRLALCDPAAISFNLVPFTDDLRKQHGLDVECLPFKFPPYDLLPFLYSQTGKSKTKEGLKLVPGGMFVAYPLLLPVYLAEYEYTIRHMSFIHNTYVLDASRNGNFYVGSAGVREVVKLARRVSPAASSLKLPPEFQVIPSNKDRLPKFFSLQVLSPGGKEIPTSDRGDIQEQLNGAAEKEVVLGVYEHLWQNRQRQAWGRDTDFEDPRICEYNPAVWLFTLLQTRRQKLLDSLTNASLLVAHGKSVVIKLSPSVEEAPSSAQASSEREQNDAPVVTTHVTVPIHPLDEFTRQGLDKLQGRPVVFKLTRSGTLLGEIHVTLTTNDSNRPPAKKKKKKSHSQRLMGEYTFDDRSLAASQHEIATAFSCLEMENAAWVKKWEAEDQKRPPASSQ